MLDDVEVINLTSVGNGIVCGFRVLLLLSFNPSFPCVPVLLLLRAIRTSPRPRPRSLTRSPSPRCRSCRRPTTSTSTSTSPASELPASSSAQGPHHNPPNPFSVHCLNILNQSSVDSHLIPSRFPNHFCQFSTDSQSDFTQFPTDLHPICSQPIPY